MNFLPRSLSLFFLPGLLLLLLLSSCSQSRTPTAGFETFLPITLDGHSISTRIAYANSERAQGLMYVESLPENHGMLFVKPTPGPQAFWMRNTPLPLDIGYFCSEGILREVHPLEPFDETPVRSRRNDILFALEMPRGWFLQNRVFPEPNTKLDLTSVRHALNQRGLSHQHF